jgi:hypothetical protein
MWLPQAVSETFRELFTLSDPNSSGTKAPKYKVKRVVKKYLQLQAGVVDREQPKTIVRYVPDAPKPPLVPRQRAPVTPPLVSAQKLPGLTPKLKKTAAKEAQKLKNNAKEPFIEDPSTWNEIIPRENTAAADRLHDPAKPTRKTTHDTLSSARRRFLFLNLGDEAILKYTSGGNPPWTNLYPNELSRRGNKAFFEDLPILLREEKVTLIKKTYFDPAAPTSIYNIHDHLQKKVANVTRREVTSALHKLEVYQRMRGRNLPNKITGRTEYFAPGYFAADTIFPGETYGWPKTVIFTVIDAWSRFCGAYIVSDKRKGTIAKAFQQFLDDFNLHSTMPPSKLMIDKGSELMGLDAVMETYSQKRPCVFRSLTAQPVNLIEGFNAQLQRMCQVYREAKIVSRFEDVLWLVTNAINNQARKDRMGYTPIELLQMNKPMREEVNANYKFRTVMPAEKSPLEIGMYVRVLMLNRKAQVDTKTKGFPAHWSQDVFQIVRRTAVIKNPGVFKYFVNSTSTGARVEGSRFRHELLRLQIESLEEIDTRVPNVPLQKVPEKAKRVEGTGEDALYDPADDRDDFSD